ncbi:rhomboid family intramembrane serine protease [Hasllibacter sp. MH4015]|uniref:rhomboid family intramembrane serine protease n=1 Tax=Hasllibacter sp. MH4015 TaxID=2854029 RepID=UPI001CD2DA52|nr:rhomboid family intramembrane serine protease [Hasllibacter sp. MH4015]
MENNNVSPFNTLPPVVVALAVVILGLELMFQAAMAGLIGGQAGVGWRLAAMQDYAVLDQVWSWMVEVQRYPPQHLVRFITYPLIHGSLIHAGFVVVFILALGKMVAEVYSPLAFIAVFWVSAIVGGLGYVIILDAEFPLIGGYPGVYGLIGAFTFLMWMRADAEGTGRLRAFALIGALLAVQLIFAVINGEFGTVVADLSGFVAGLSLSFVVSPGGWRRMLARMRQR